MCRGGEIISPAEVEDAVGSHPSVKEAMAFPVHHDILQASTAAILCHKACTSDSTDARSLKRNNPGGMGDPHTLMAGTSMPENCMPMLPSNTSSRMTGTKMTGTKSTWTHGLSNVCCCVISHWDCFASRIQAAIS